MALFGKKVEGGLMDVIRCDQQEYLVWKWRPTGDVNSTNKENAIRWGSSLRVKEGEVAVFVYKQNDGQMQDFIVGPRDEIITTANLPVISSIIGLAYAGKSPFQAEIYFINLAGNIQVKFGVPYFDVFDPRFLDFGVPMAVRGTITFNITDYKAFIKLHRMINFEIDDFTKQIRDALSKYIKGHITNLPSANGMPVLQIERKIMEVSDLLEHRIRGSLSDDFGVNIKRFDLAAIEVDKESDGYSELRRVTAEQQTRTIEGQTTINLKNLEDTQRINAENVEGSLLIQREEMQRKQRLQTESQHLTAHQIDQQTVVLTAAADSMGSMGNIGGSGNGGGGGMNPAGIMTGMMLGGAMGGQMSNMMNQIGQNIQQQQVTPPPPPTIQYSVAINGATLGPFNWQQLLDMVNSGQLTKNIHVWKQGMANWELAGNVQELSPIFGAAPPPPPPIV